MQESGQSDQVVCAPFPAEIVVTTGAGPDDVAIGGSNGICRESSGTPVRVSLGSGGDDLYPLPGCDRVFIDDPIPTSPVLHPVFSADGSPGADDLTGGAFGDTLDGGDGSDTLDGGDFLDNSVEHFAVDDGPPGRILGRSVAIDRDGSLSLRLRCPSRARVPCRGAPDYRRTVWPYAGQEALDRASRAHRDAAAEVVAARGASGEDAPNGRGEDARARRLEEGAAQHDPASAGAAFAALGGS